MSIHRSTRILINPQGVNTASGGKNTVEFWMYWRGDEGIMPFGWNSSYGLYFTGGRFGFNTGNGDCLGISSNGLKNRWTHVAAVFHNGVPSASTVELYIDGVKQNLSGNGNGSVNAYATNGTAYIGGWGYSGAYLFIGRIKDLRIWNRQLTAAEIQANMNTKGLISGSGLVGCWEYDIVENLSQQYYDAYAMPHNFNGSFSPASLTNPSSGATYPFDDGSQQYQGFYFGFDSQVNFTKLRFKSHPSYPCYNVSIYVEGKAVAEGVTITGDWTEFNGNWLGRSIQFVRKGTGVDQTIQKVEFWGEQRVGTDKIKRLPNNLTSWYTYNMGTIQIDNTKHVIGTTGHGGQELWKMLRNDPTSNTLSPGRSYIINGTDYTSTHTDCFDYNPWNDHLYFVHNESPYTLFKYRINKNSDTSWSLTRVATYQLPNDPKFNSWTGIKFAFNHQSNDGYLYMVANYTGHNNISLYRIPIDTNNATPELVCYMPWYYSNNLCSFAVTDEFVVLPFSNSQIGFYSKKTGNPVFLSTMPDSSINSYFNASSFMHSGKLYIIGGGYSYDWAQFTVDSSLRIENITSNSPIRRDNLTINGKITTYNLASKVGYRVEVNNEQFFPQSGYTTFANAPLPFTVSIPHSAFVSGNNTVTIYAVDDQGGSTWAGLLAVKLNDAPDATLTLVENPVHENNAILLATVTDFDGDEVAYQILLNDVQVYPAVGWTSFSIAPFDVNYYFQNNILLEGSNKIVFKVKDNEGGVREKTIYVSKVNNAPTIENGEVKGLTVTATIKDIDRDKVKYRVLVGGTKVYPDDGDWSLLLPTPFSIKHDIPISKFIPGNSYPVLIEAEDHLGKPATTWSTSALLDYAGLMFTDETGSYYSTDIGEVIKYLDMGTIVAGDSSSVYKVFLKNTSATKYTNIILTTDQGDLDPVEEKVVISKTDAPFDPQTVLDFPGVTLDYGDSVQFYVRLDATRRAIGGGKFKIWVSGDPTL